MKKTESSQERINFIYLQHKTIFQDADLYLTDQEILKFNQNSNSLITNKKDMDNTIARFVKYPTLLSIYYYAFDHPSNVTIDGDYQFIDDAAKQALSALKTVYPSLNINEHTVEFGEAESFLQSDTMKSFYEQGFMLCIIISVCFLIYYSQNEGMLSIKKMHRYSTLHLLYRGNRNLLLQIAIVNIIILFLSILLEIQALNTYVFVLISYLLIFIGIELFIFSITIVFVFFFFQSVSIVSLLKHNKKNRSMLFLNFILRFIILLYSVFSITTNLPSLLSNGSEVLQYASFKDNIKTYERVTYAKKSYGDERDVKYYEKLNQILENLGDLD